MSTAREPWKRLADVSYPILSAALKDLAIPDDALVADVLGDEKYFVLKWMDATGHGLVLDAVTEATESKDCIEYDAMRKIIREYCVPRGVAFFAGADIDFYEYGGGKTAAQHLSLFPGVSALVAHVNDKYAGADKYTAALLNVYRTLHDKIDMHSDKDVATTEAVGVVCASVGMPRELVFKKKTTKDSKASSSTADEPRVLRVTKEDGMFLAMVGPGFQEAIQHGIPRRSGGKQTESAPWSASFTFRRHHAKPKKRGREKSAVPRPEKRTRCAAAQGRDNDNA